jgi:phosphomethylpyrimidine synthase
MKTLSIGNSLGKTNLLFGQDLPTLINFIVGVSKNDQSALDLERAKIGIAVEMGVHTITDLSIFRPNLPLWMYVKEKYPHVGVGINPPYFSYIENRGKISPKKVFGEIKNFILNGGDQMTMNFFPRNVEELNRLSALRMIPITSRQGGMLAAYMRKYSADNPYYEIFDDIVTIVKEYGVFINIGASFRPAGICEANDFVHNWEIEQQFNLYQKLSNLGVKSALEIMSHQPLETIGSGIQAIRERHGSYVPFQLLGPMVTDFVGAEDHIAAAIGIAEASRYNVGKITMVPPREHVGFPSLDDSRIGIRSALIAVHAGDSTRIPGLRDIDRKILEARANHLSCNPESVRQGCEKCGNYCPLIIAQKTK